MKLGNFGKVEIHILQKIENFEQYEPAHEYHSKAAYYLSSHQLMDFIKCPYLYHKKQIGLIDDSESQAFLLGRAAHSLILEGRSVYEDEFAIGGPINPTTGRPFGNTTKKFLEWQAEQRKPVLTFDQSETVEAMNAAVSTNQYAVELLKSGRAEGVVRTNYCGLPCQIRMDWFNPDYGIIDLKTCDDLTWFESDARRFRYQNQMAFYQCVLDAGESNVPLVMHRPNHRPWVVVLRLNDLPALVEKINQFQRRKTDGQ